jgi:hypothetical protein
MMGTTPAPRVSERRRCKTPAIVLDAADANGPPRAGHTGMPRRTTRPSARERDVFVLGGASIVQECLHAGLLNDLRLHEGVSHFTFRVGTRR